MCITSFDVYPQRMASKRRRNQLIMEKSHSNILRREDDVASTIMYAPKKAGDLPYIVDDSSDVF